MGGLLTYPRPQPGRHSSSTAVLVNPCLDAVPGCQSHKWTHVGGPPGASQRIEEAKGVCRIVWLTLRRCGRTKKARKSRARDSAARRRSTPRKETAHVTSSGSPCWARGDRSTVSRRCAAGDLAFERYEFRAN